MPFQSKVNTNQAPGVRGDFASMNPFSSVLAGPGALVAPVGGLTVAHFGFVNPANLAVSAGFTAGFQIGFHGRNENALITTFLGESTMVVPQGFMVNLFSGGDFWARFNGGITAGGTVYADVLTGAPTNAATNTATAAAGAAGTLTTNVTAGTANQVTVNTVTGGAISVGDVAVTTNVPTGTTITGQISGTAGGTGVYSLSANATAAAGPTAFTVNSLFLKVSALLTGGLSTNDTITGSGVTAGTTLTSVPVTGSLGLGNYGLSVAQQFASTTVTGPTGTATQFKAATSCLPGEIAKISASVT